MLYPIVVGGGKRLFGDAPDETSLRLVAATPSADTVLLRYQPA